MTKDLEVFVDENGRFWAYAESGEATGAFVMPARVALGFVVKGQWALLKANIIPGYEWIKERFFPFLMARDRGERSAPPRRLPTEFDGG